MLVTATCVSNINKIPILFYSILFYSISFYSILMNFCLGLILTCVFSVREVMYQQSALFAFKFSII